MIEGHAAAGAGAGGQSLPFTKATETGGFLFVSDQVPIWDGKIVPGGIVDRSERATESIPAILTECCYGFERVVKVNVWLDGPRDFRNLDKVFQKHLGGHPPAHSTVDAKIEMDSVAYRTPD